MALDETLVSAGATNGLKTLSLSSVPALETTVNVTGAILTATGIVLVMTPLIIMTTKFFIKKFHKNSDGSLKAALASPNGKVILSVIVASALLISVGTAMLPRTETVMIIHIIAGYTCLIVSLIHVWQYRKVIKTQAKKYMNFLNAPKKPPVAVVPRPS